MLTIKNYNKLFRKDVTNEWRIGKIEELYSTYLIMLYNSTGKLWQINLERTPISNQNEYELWCWLNDKPTAIPIRTMLKIEDIKNIDGMVSNIEYLLHKASKH